MNPQYDLSKVKTDASGNVMIGNESVNPQFLSQDGYNQAVQFAVGGTTAPSTGAGAPAVPPSTLSPYFPSSNGTGGTGTAQPGQGMDPSSFQSLLGQVGLTLQNNNQLSTYKSLLSKNMFDSPLTQQELSALPPDIQKIVQSGDPDALQLQMRVLNDQIAGRTKTLDSSISYLTQGYQTAQDQQKNAYTTVLNYAKALNAKPSDVLSALYPNLINNIPKDQLAALDALGKPLLTSTQIPNEGVGGGLSLQDALVGQESGGDYSAVNPLSGALGKYQIMPEHLVDLGLDPNNQADVQKFLGSPALQDQEFQNIMNNLQTTYAGNTDQMIAAYYGGDAAAQIVGTPAADAPQKGGYPSINDYVASVKAKMQPNIVDANPPSPEIANVPDSTTGLTPNAIYADAVQYATSGVMPSLGMGSSPQIKAARAAIQNKAGAILAAGGGNIAANKAQLKSLSATLTQQSEYANTIQRSLSTVDKNIQILQEAAKSVNDSSAPIVNQVSNNIKLSTGDGALNAFKAAVQTVRSEYGNILARGGTVTDTVRNEASTLIPDNITLDQLNQVIGVLKSEGENVLSSAQAQQKSVHDQISGILQPQDSGGGTSSGSDSNFTHLYDQYGGK